MPTSQITTAWPRRTALAVGIVALALLAAVLWPHSESTAAAGGSISGTVTDEHTGEPLQNIFVSLYDTSFQGVAPVRTDATGHYSISGLSTGGYKVEFWDGGARTYLSEWYNDQPDRESAELVTVTEKETTEGIDAELAFAGSISGTVTDEDTGLPLANIAVRFSATSHSFGGGTGTDASGGYSIRGLPADDYKLRFNFPNTGMYLSEWYDEQPDRESADLVAVTEKEETAGIDVALALGGSINGTVTDENTGEPLEGVCVSASDASNVWFGHGYTDASGNYSAGGLRTGHYKLNFHDCTDGRVYEWYNDQPDWESADLVAVTEKEKTGDIDAAIALGLVGDVNRDGVINSIDAALVLQYSAGLARSLLCQDACDANGDGVVNSIDAALILQYTAGLLPELPG